MTPANAANGRPLDIAAPATTSSQAPSVRYPNHHGMVRRMPHPGWVVLGNRAGLDSTYGPLGGGLHWQHSDGIRLVLMRT